MGEIRQKRVGSFVKALDYELDATDLAGIADRLLNDTKHFSITSNDRLTSIGLLELGEYELYITVYPPMVMTEANRLTLLCLTQQHPQRHQEFLHSDCSN